MKSFIKIISLIVLTFSLFSCGESEPTVNKAEEERKAELNPKRENRENRPLQKDQWTIAEAIEMWVENLDIRLSLSPEVKNNIKTAYTNAYSEKGGDFDKIITKEEAMELRKEIVSNTQDEVMPLLTEDQKVYYKRFIKE